MKEEITRTKGPASTVMQKRLETIERDMIAKPLLTGTLSG